MTDHRLILLVAVLTVAGCDRPTTAPLMSPTAHSPSEYVEMYDQAFFVDVAPNWYASSNGSISVWSMGARVEVHLSEYSADNKLRDAVPDISGGYSVFKIRSYESAQSTLTINTDCGRNYRGRIGNGEGDEY